jgi:hypothetical protein
MDGLYLMVEIKYYKFNYVQIVILFKILNDVSVYTLLNP